MTFNDIYVDGGDSFAEKCGVVGYAVFSRVAQEQKERGWLVAASPAAKQHRFATAQPGSRRVSRLALEVLKGGVAVGAVFEGYVAALVVDVEGGHDGYRVFHHHANGERVGGIAVRSGEELG